jgi:hypothetical protein
MRLRRAKATRIGPALDHLLLRRIKRLRELANMLRRNILALIRSSIHALFMIRQHVNCRKAQLGGTPVIVIEKNTLEVLRSFHTQ